MEAKLSLLVISHLWNSAFLRYKVGTSLTMINKVSSRLNMQL